MTPGIGEKSPRTLALELHRLRWPLSRIVNALATEATEAEIREWIHPKPRARVNARGAISPATPEQRAKVKGKACVRCRRAGPCQPAHLIDRSLASVGADDSRAVIPLCPECHRAYDEESISLLEHLEPHYREELAFAVERVGLLTALFRISNERWKPESFAPARAAA
jgi:hypothetical protein